MRRRAVTDAQCGTAVQELPLHWSKPCKVTPSPTVATIVTDLYHTDRWHYKSVIHFRPTRVNCTSEFTRCYTSTSRKFWLLRTIAMICIVRRYFSCNFLIFSKTTKIRKPKSKHAIRMSQQLLSAIPRHNAHKTCSIFLVS